MYFIKYPLNLDTARRKGVRPKRYQVRPEVSFSFVEADSLVVFNPFPDLLTLRPRSTNSHFPFPPSPFFVIHKRSFITRHFSLFITTYILVPSSILLSRTLINVRLLFTNLLPFLTCMSMLPLSYRFGEFLPFLLPWICSSTMSTSVHIDSTIDPS